MASTVRFGFDIGGTKILGVAIGADGEVVAESRCATPANLDLLLATITDLYAELASQVRMDGPCEVARVGIGVPAPVLPSGSVVSAPNLHCIDGLETPSLEAVLGRPVHVGNDAKCAGLAEAVAGAAVGHRNVLVLAVGTGIGGAHLVDGRLQLGHSGLAGEFGHMVVDPRGRQCGCGQVGCWETVAAGSSLTRSVAEALISHSMLQPSWRDGEPAKGEWAIELARASDSIALELVNEYARWFAIGLVNLVNAFDPETIVVGGGIVASFDVLGPAIASWFERLWGGTGARTPPRLVPAILGERAGAIGAALLGGDEL